MSVRRSVTVTSRHDVVSQTPNDES